VNRDALRARDAWGASPGGPGYAHGACDVRHVSWMHATNYFSYQVSRDVSLCGQGPEARGAYCVLVTTVQDHGIERSRNPLLPAQTSQERVTTCE
jgi:hypothetical protein